MLRLPVSSLILPTASGYDGALGLGRDHMPRTHRVKEGRRQFSTTPTTFFISLVYFCFHSGRIKYSSTSPIDIILLSQGLQALHKTVCNGASQPQE